MLANVLTFSRIVLAAAFAVVVGVFAGRGELSASVAIVLIVLAFVEEITDVLDIVSPPNRMFIITHRAQDGRHVVLLQSASYNKMLGPMTKLGKLVYTSPRGVKVWSGPRDKWLAGILLQSARATIKDSPSEDRTGYLLETPVGTYPALAINGQASDEELHRLVDSLVPAKASE